MLNALIVDDEPLAHQVILHHLQGHRDIHVSGQCYHATDALRFLANHAIDLLFLDINMPALSGIELLKVLANRPQVIIISAYQDYALAGFELDVTDYLLKPVDGARLSVALDKVRLRAQLTHPQAAAVPLELSGHIVLKVEREKHKVALKDISYLEAYGNYVKVWQGDAMTLANATLKQLLAELPDAFFVQVHKSFVVNKQHISALTTQSLQLTTGQTIKIGKSYKVICQYLL